MRDTKKPRVLIWTAAVLPGSETFVRNQFDALARWEGKLSGLTRLDTPLARSNDAPLYGKSLREVASRKLFSLTGRSRRARALLRAWRPQVVHAHFLQNGWRISESARAEGIPLIITTHGHDVTSWTSTPGLRGALFRHRAKVALQRAALVIAVSEFIRDRTVALGADPAKVIVHHIGIPIPSLVEKPRQPKWDVVFVGRFTPKKGVLDLIDALSVVAKSRAISAVFVGDGPLMSDARRRATQSDADISFLGALPPNKVHSVLEQSRVFAAPSKTAADGDSEGLPTVVLEAASVGLPTVATCHSGIPEAVDDGNTGLLSPEADPTALAANLLKLLNDPELASQLGAQGRHRVEEHFDIAQQTVALEEIYDAVAGYNEATQ